jgi:MFS family permease
LSATAAVFTDQTGEGEFHRGWRVVLASALGICFGLSPMPIYTMGIFAPHLAQAFGWSIAQIMASLTVTTIALLIAAPTVGWMSGRYGVRRIALISQVLFGLSFMALGLSNGSLPLYYANWALVTFCGAGTLPITWTYAVNNWFQARKGLALGIAMAGTGLFGTIVKPIFAALIPVTGWREGYFLLGLLPILIGFPITFFLFRDKAPVQSGTPAPLSGLTFRAILGEWRFWLMVAAILPISLVLSGTVPNMETILKHAGISAMSIIALAPMIGFSALVGRIVGGWLLDRFWAPAVGCLILCLPTISCTMLAGGALTTAQAAGAVFLIGFALGIEYDLIAYMVSRYFGNRAYSATYTALYVAFTLGAGSGPMLMGWDYDRHHSFALSLTLSAVVLAVSAVSLLAMGRYRTFTQDAAT